MKENLIEIYDAKCKSSIEATSTPILQNHLLCDVVFSNGQLACKSKIYRIIKQFFKTILL